MRREFMCEFSDWDDGAFSRNPVEAAFDKNVPVIGLGLLAWN